MERSNSHYECGTKGSQVKHNLSPICDWEFSVENDKHNVNSWAAQTRHAAIFGVAATDIHADGLWRVSYV